MGGGRGMPNPKYLRGSVTCLRGIASPWSGRILLVSQCIGVGSLAFCLHNNNNNNTSTHEQIACCPVVPKGNYLDKEPKEGHMSEIILLDQYI